MLIKNEGKGMNIGMHGYTSWSRVFRLDYSAVAILLVPFASQCLSKLRPLSEPLSLPVEHIDGDRHDERENGQDRCRPLEVQPVSGSAHIAIERSRVQGCDTG